MKATKFLALLVAVVLGGQATAENDSEVRIELAGLQSVSGKIFIAVYNEKKSWLGDDAFTSKEVVIDDAREDELVATSITLPPGEYAMTVFYDANDNGELDTNFIGIPNEPIALSNNARAKFGPPKYDDAKFTLGSENLVQQIRMEKVK
jgi:uncharacterized protein (DUF2141 family)